VFACAASTDATVLDRDLILVPKKGRPVTQCQHCRQERKKRSAHVRCECGEADKPHHPKEKCIHLREAEEKAKANGFFEDHHDEKDPSHLAAVTEEQDCCCPHGGKCTCALLKKEDDFGGSPPHGKPAVQKPRLESHKSESAITVFANGHHKPVHRKNHAAHECGMPYKMPMPRHKQDPSASRIARRSMDNLSLNTQNMVNIPSANPTPLFPAARRMSKSEQTSPRLRPSLFGNLQGLSDNQLSTIDFIGLDSVRTNDTAQSTTSESGFQTTDPISSVADNFFDPWSALPSGDSQTLPNNNPFGVWPTRHDLSGVNQPALTAASSGTQSEADEIPIMEDVFEPGMPSIQEDVNFDRNGLMPDNTNLNNRRSLPPNFFGNADFAMTFNNTNWPAQFDAYNNTNDKMKVMDLQQQSPMFDNTWQMPMSQPLGEAPPHPVAGLPMPAAPSIPQSSGTRTPPDDIMRTLFPEMDFDDDTFGADNTFKQASQTSAPSITSAIDLGALSDADMTFVTQSWTDGSLSVPNDPFTSPYAFSDDYSSQNYSSGWTQ
jgi:hypothetical protein